MKTNNKDIKVSSLSKALSLLDYFDNDHKMVGVTELAKHSGLPKSTVQNILSTFRAHGYVVQDSRSRKYMLGGELVSLFSRYKSTRNLDYRVTEYLQTIRDKYNVEAYLAEIDSEKWQIIYLASEQPRSGLHSIVSKVGQEAPIHATAAGKILIGLSSAEIRTKYFDYLSKNPPERYTDATMVEPKELAHDATESAYRGYALCEGEYHDLINAISVPIIVGFRDIHYAIGVIETGTFFPHIQKQLVADLQYCAKKIGSFLENSSNN